LGKLAEDLLAILRSLLGPIQASLRRNTGLALLSLALAFTLWIFITDTERDIRTGVLPFDAVVETVNVPPDVVVGVPISPLRLRIEVAEDEWESLTTVDFRATVDLFGQPQGTHELPVRAETLSGRGGLRIIQAIPDKVEVTLEPLFSKAVPVVVQTISEPPRGYEMEDPQPESDNVIVSGPEGLVSLVRDAVTKVDVTGQTSDFKGALTLRATDALGRSVERVVLEPEVMNVLVPIRPTQFSRVLLVSPTLQGTAAAGYNVVSVSLDPSVVTAVGPLETLSGLNVIRTAGVDITDATTNVVRQVSLEVPPGVSIVEGDEVRVTARVAQAQGQATFQVVLNAQNLSPDLRLATSLPILEVSLSGPVPLLSTISALDIVATLDLEDLMEGGHTVQPRVQVPSGLVMASLFPSPVQVVLEPKP
jgi:YbbR domain-containing protein